MTDEKYIRKAVELAYGFRMNTPRIVMPPFGGPWDLSDLVPPSSIRHMVLDALAAQLVRQVEEIPGDEDGKPECVVGRGSALIEVDDPAEALGYRNLAWVESEDRTMNTIKAIVDSGLLQHSQFEIERLQDIDENEPSPAQRKKRYGTSDHREHTLVNKND